MYDILIDHSICVLGKVFFNLFVQYWIFMPVLHKLRIALKIYWIFF